MPLRRAKAYLNVARNRGARLRGALPLPRVAWLIPTWYCDLKCVTCGIWRRPRDASDLSPEAWGRLLKEVAFLDIVKLLGGEPFTREDVWEIGVKVQEIVEPSVFHVVTAGKETERILHFAERVGAANMHLRVSIDGKGEVHETLRQTPGLHDKAMATLEGLIPLRDRIGFSLGVNVSVNDKTLPHLKPLKEWCDDRGVTIAPGIPVTPFLEDINPEEVTPRAILVDDQEGVLKALSDMTERPQGGYNPLERLSMERVNQRIWERMIREEGLTLKGASCEALRSFIYLLPDGGLSSCGLRQGSIGNILDEGFLRLWEGHAAKAQRHRNRHR